MDADRTAADEYRAVREGVGLVDRSGHGLVEVTRRDRATFLHALLTNDVKSLAPGQGCAACLLDVQGKVQVALLVWVLEERILLVTPPGLAGTTVEMLDRYLFTEKVTLDDVTGSRAMLLLAGPGADDLSRALAGAVPGEQAWASVPGRFAGADVLVVRGGGETGGPEVWLVAPVAAGDALREAATAAGARPIGETALESLRIEAGTAGFGREVDATVLLPEIPFLHLVSYTKGCYPGQEVVVRIRDRGHVNRHLRGLVLDGERVPLAGAEVLADGAAVGHVTSATTSLGIGRPIALAFVRRQHAEPGTKLEVRIDGATVPAQVSDLPFAR